MLVKLASDLVQKHLAPLRPKAAKPHRPVALSSFLRSDFIAPNRTIVTECSTGSQSFSLSFLPKKWALRLPS